MKTVMGLFEQADELGRAQARLRAASVPENRMHALASTQAVREHMDCSHRGSVIKYALGGAILIGGIYIVFGLSAGLCSSAMGVPGGWCAGAAVVFTLIGGGLGAFMGAFIGRAEAERDTHLYIEGVRRGDVLLLVQVEDKLASQALAILRQQNALGVRVCSRMRQIDQAPGVGHPRPLQM